MKLPVSCIILAKNESENIIPCIRSLEKFEECIVIDNGSTDDTAEKVLKENATVYYKPNLNFAEMRLFGAKKSTQNWLLYVDADERVTLSLVNEIQDKIFTQKKTNDSYWIERENYYYGYSRWPKNDKHLRLFRKKSLLSWHGVLHESPDVEGSIGYLNSPLIHYTHSNLHAMVIKTNDWSKIEAELRVKNNHPPIAIWRLIRVMLTGWLHSYIAEEGYKTREIGIIESVYQSFSYFITYAKVWEIQQQNLSYEFIS